MSESITDPTTSGPDLELELRSLLQAIESGSRAVLPASDDALLESIVTAAARIFGAAAATLFLVDDEGESLLFRVAVGQNPYNVLGMKIPINKGIAGYVAMTGQPIAVSSTEQDARFYASFAKSTGYVPQSILASPLLSGERVIGVLEVLDKIDAASFGLQDMELMGLFARQAALAIEQAQRLEQAGEALRSGLQRIAAEEGLAEDGPLRVALAERTPSASAADIQVLAELFNDINALGSAERQAAIKILSALAELGRSKRQVRKSLR
ncbi:MAG: GAF domain-containing protein [Candidatus Promineifilaceae bacterium]